MTILFLNSSSYSHTPIDKWTDDTDETIICITPAKNVAEYKEKLSEGKFEIVAIKDWEDKTTIDIAINTIYNKKIFNKVISMREKDIIHAAYIREHFELMGQTISSAMAFRDKYVMKNLAIQNNIKVPIFSKVNTFFDVVNFTNKNKFPVVVKPRLGAGSVDTFIINNSLEMEENLRGVDLKNFIIEEFIDGSIFHVDGLIKDG
ncbi:nikkomycin biosynthesis protein, partial [Listeria monocytogenes]|nr:nikkomycin biosynthesis protein [Listeria monocytogenes]